MAANQPSAQDLQESILLKIDGKTVEEYLEALSPERFNAPGSFIYPRNAIINFSDMLSRQSKETLAALCKDKKFSVWLRKAAEFLSGFLFDKSIFNSNFQKKIQPLLNLLYHFKEADPTIKNVLFKFELVKLLESTENSERDYIKEAAHLRNVLIGQPIYVLDILYNNEKFSAWLVEAVTFLSTCFSNPSIFTPDFQQKIQPLIDFLYYVSRDRSIRTLLCRFEVIKQLTEKSTVHSEENYKRIFGSYFEHRLGDVFDDRTQSVEFIIDTALSNCRKTEKKFALESQLEQACFVAWLVPYIKSRRGSTCFDKTRSKELIKYLDELYNKHFSPHCVNQTYSAQSRFNSSLGKQFEAVETIINEKLKSINIHNPSELEQEPSESQPKIDLKDFFLQLFPPAKRSSFFSSFQYPIVNDVMETDELYIDWHYVVEHLLAEIEQLPLDPSKAQALSKKINSFIKTWEETLASKIPDLSKIDSNAEKAAGKEEEKENSGSENSTSLRI